MAKITQLLYEILGKCPALSLRGIQANIDASITFVEEDAIISYLFVWHSSTNFGTLYHGLKFFDVRSLIELQSSNAKSNLLLIS